MSSNLIPRERVFSSSTTQIYALENFHSVDHEDNIDDSASHSLINPNVTGNRLYQRVDGSIAIEEKPIGYIIGEQVVAPMINLVSYCAKATFNAGSFCFKQAISPLYHFHILPTASAEEIPSPEKADFEAFDKQNLPRALETCSALIEKANAIDKEHLKELYYQQGMIYKRMGMFKKAEGSFSKACEIDLFFSKAKQELSNVERFLANKKVDEYRTNFLKEIGFDLPSHYEYLLMSALSYEAVEFGELLKDCFASVSSNTHAEYLSGKGWKVAAVSERRERGYFGVAFIHSEKKRLIVAHRGTRFDSAEDLMNDFDIFQSKKPDHYSSAITFVQTLSQTHQGYEISHTGHSLGAVIAELVACDRQERAITADSPGVASMISSPLSNEKLRDTRIISYLSVPNFINTCSGHIGKQRSVDVHKQGASVFDVARWGWGWFSPSPTLKGAWASLGFNSAELLELMASDIEYHKIDRLLERFDPHCGQTSYRFVKKWPKGVQERMQFNTICGRNCVPTNPDQFTEEKRVQFGQIYQTEETFSSKMKIEEFSSEARNFLLNLHSYDKIPETLSPQVLGLYYLEHDRICIRSDDALFTIQDFHDYIEDHFSKKPLSAPSLVPNPFYEKDSSTSKDATKIKTPPSTPASTRKPSTQNLHRLIQYKLNNPKKELSIDESIELLLECIRQGDIEAEKAKGKDVTIVIGNTGSAKSTTINYLFGCSFELKPYKDLGIKGIG
ncbi:MAG: DUF2974 domain-containing protein, partial [Halobacteriovoraceae bacterium]|nr:DUF2974 domain-containing protein [Halobacteriovoraceae bacterium]